MTIKKCLSEETINILCDADINAIGRQFYTIAEIEQLYIIAKRDTITF